MAHGIHGRFIGYKYWAFADPIGAIVISFYIMGSWFSTGWRKISILIWTDLAQATRLLSAHVYICVKCVNLFSLYRTNKNAYGTHSTARLLEENHVHSIESPLADIAHRHCASIPFWKQFPCRGEMSLIFTYYTVVQISTRRWCLSTSKLCLWVLG